MNEQECEKEWVSKFDPLVCKLRENLSNETYLWAQNNSNRLKELEVMMIKEKLYECYEKLIYAHDHYLDWDEREIKLQSVWDIATYFFRGFSTFPYKFVTAMKGSGKSRLLKFTEAVVWNGLLTSGMSDSALFRSANDHTLIFDEAESITSKEKKQQRLILNAGYKRGGCIQVSKEKYTDKVKTFILEKYPVYCPKMLANIFGMEDVLGDRCIFSIMEKSNNPAKVKLMEDFDTNPFFSELKRTLEKVSVVWCSVVSQKNAQEGWDSYITNKYTTTPLYTTYTKLHQTTLEEKELELFNKIDEAGLDGRYLELYYPLFMTAKIIREDILEEIIKIAKWKVGEKKENEILESKDISVIDFISRQADERAITFTKLSDLINEFKHFFENDEESIDWLNSRWMGRALTRLNLITKKRRLGQGIEVILNIVKAKEKLKIFKVENE